jgi:hypothetical protein
MVSGNCTLQPRRPPQCSCVVIESSFDPSDRLQAPGSLWFSLKDVCGNTGIEWPILIIKKYFYKIPRPKATYFIEVIFF